MSSSQEGKTATRILDCRRHSILENVEHVCQMVQQELENFDLNRKDCFAVSLLLREALNNAVLHGCRQNPNLSFSCSMKFSPDEVTIEVNDDGAGFDWRKQVEQANRKQPEETEERGRGFQIFRLYASSTSFNDIGNCVRLTRKLTKGEPNE